MFPKINDLIYSLIIKNYQAKQYVLHRYLNVLNLIRPFQVNQKDFDLIRIGPDSDGGYVIPKIFERFYMLISFGIGSNNDLEKIFSKKMLVKQFDHSIDGPPLTGKNLEFYKIKITKNFNFDFYLKDKKPENVVLKCDIEGSEWEILEKIIRYNFGLLIIEIHGLESSIIGYSANKRNKILDALSKKYTTLHIHANNCCGFYEGTGWRVPKVVELTLIHNNLIDNFIKNPSKLIYPTRLDFPNKISIPDLYLGNLWSDSGIGIN